MTKEQKEKLIELRALLRFQVINGLDYYTNKDQEYNTDIRAAYKLLNEVLDRPDDIPPC